MKKSMCSKTTPAKCPLLVLSANNILSHLVCLTEMNFSPGYSKNMFGSCLTTSQEPSQAAGDFLAFLPRRCQIVENHCWDQGQGRPVPTGRSARPSPYTVMGGCRSTGGGRISTCRDDPTVLALAYGLVNECFQQKDSAAATPKKRWN